MNDTELAKIVTSLLDRPVAFMTDQQLALWLKGCQVMERKVRSAKARRNWTHYRVEAETEHRRREAIDAEARENALHLSQPHVSHGL
jgi:hypothetical protein